MSIDRGEGIDAVHAPGDRAAVFDVRRARRVAAEQPQAPRRVVALGRQENDRSRTWRKSSAALGGKAKCWAFWLGFFVVVAHFSFVVVVAKWRGVKSLGIRIDFRDEARGKQVTNSNSSRERLTIDARERWI